MVTFQRLQDGIDRGEVIILDGAVGTQLQAMGVPMNNFAWAASALQTHPYTVRRLHENYIKAGVDIITTNSYASARHNLEPLGLADLTAELNIRAVELAKEARERAARDRPVYIAGSVSNFGLVTGGEPRKHRSLLIRNAITAEQAQANLREQAELLVESGVDFLLCESTGSLEHRQWVSRACSIAGVPKWVGFKCHTDKGDSTVRIGYSSETPLAQALDEVLPLGGSVVNVFHTNVDDTTAALPIVMKHWSGAVGVYPEAARTDYVDTYRDPEVQNNVSVEGFVELARKWVGQGVQIIGGCCGIGVEYIRPLRQALPQHIPTPRRLVTAAAPR
jgi:S-methylmethionine-dependent homocysteine/selenocysteine methylase